MSDRPYWSTTRLDLLCRCGEAYRRRYVEGDIVPPGIAMLKGTSVDRAATLNFTQKVQTRKDLPERDIVAVAVETFDAHVRQDGLTLSAEESSIKLPKLLGGARDDIAEMASVHAQIQAPDYQPIAVQRQFRLELPGTHDLVGVIDLEDDRQRVTDIKTSGKAKTQEDADTSLQLTCYAAAFASEYGSMPAEVRLDTIILSPSRLSRQVVHSTRNARDLAALAARINVASAAVQAGNYLPATPGAWWCGPRWCGYWSTCPYVNNERKALVQISGEKK